MSILTLIAVIPKVLESLVDPKLQRFVLAVIRHVRHPQFSYENVLLRYELDIADDEGHRARLTRTQEVRFLTTEAGVIRELVWGDGLQSVGYRASGARPVAKQQEGMTSVVWLGLPAKPAPGERARIRSTRTIVDGLLEKEEFLEVRVERPTNRLSLLVMFPASREPSSAYVETDSNGSPRVRLKAIRWKGRSCLRWSRSEPGRDIYRLRWSW